jgi:hypothetical protein
VTRQPSRRLKLVAEIICLSGMSGKSKPGSSRNPDFHF